MKLKVLMLGWEHPPFFNGGLGVASSAIAEQLSSLVDLQMLVPKSGLLPFSLPYELIGLNQLSLPPRSLKVSREWEEKLKEVKINYVEVDLQGYELLPPHVRKAEKQEGYLSIKKKVVKEIKDEGPFLMDDLYGSDLYEKVMEYTEIVREMASEMEFDLIHAHDWMTFLAGLQLKALSGKPLILHVHSLQYDRGGSELRDGIYRIERHAMAQADHILAVSKYTAEIIQRFYGISEQKIGVVHNGFQKTEPYRSPKPFAEKLVIFLGRLTGQKGPEYFFKAAKKILSQRSDIRFMLAGKGELIQPLIEAAAEEQLGDRIHFTGFLEPDRVRELMAMADVYVMPSVSEPFGLSALEAAHMGVPVIISETSGVREVLKHAIAVDYQDTGQMVKVITGIIDDPSWGRRIVAGQRKDLKGLGWEETAKKILEVYEKVANEKRQIA